MIVLASWVCLLAIVACPLLEYLKLIALRTVTGYCFMAYESNLTDVTGLREVFSYGMFSSLNAFIARLSEGADRLLLGAFFGLLK